MKKIGIYTFWNVPNYGTFAQAYALQKVISERYPACSCKQIGYLDKKHYNAYYSAFKGRPWHREFYTTLLSYVLPHSVAQNRRKQFLEAYKTIPHVDAKTREQVESEAFDVVMIGSDIVWDYSIPIFNRDKLLFGIGFHSKCVVSYGASFGTVKESAKHPQYVVEGIMKMDAISVRDDKSQRIVFSITGENPPVVLDPTWLWDFSSDANIKEVTYKNYIVVYGQDFSDEFIQQIISYSRKKRLKIICLDCNNDNYSWCDIVIKQHELSPYQWIAMFKYADLIATSTFHGITFSLIFQKKFAFAKTDFIMAKCENFLKELGLYDRFANNDSVERMIEDEWDYNRIESIIGNKRAASFAYLDKVILGV